MYAIGRFDFLGYHFKTVATPLSAVPKCRTPQRCPTLKQASCPTTDERASLNLPTNVSSAVGIPNSIDLAIIKEATSSEVKTIKAVAPKTQQTATPKVQRTRSVQLSLAQKTIDNFLEKISQLYEQSASFERIGKYIRRWEAALCGVVNANELLLSSPS